MCPDSALVGERCMVKSNPVTELRTGLGTYFGLIRVLCMDKLLNLLDIPSGSWEIFFSTGTSLPRMR